MAICVYNYAYHTYRVYLKIMLIRIYFIYLIRLRS